MDIRSIQRKNRGNKRKIASEEEEEETNEEDTNQVSNSSCVLPSGASDIRKSLVSRYISQTDHRLRGANLHRKIIYTTPATDAFVA